MTKTLHIKYCFNDKKYLGLITILNIFYKNKIYFGAKSMAKILHIK